MTDSKAAFVEKIMNGLSVREARKEAQRKQARIDFHNYRNTQYDKWLHNRARRIKQGRLP